MVVPQIETDYFPTIVSKKPKVYTFNMIQKPGLAIEIEDNYTRFEVVVPVPEKKTILIK